MQILYQRRNQCASLRDARLSANWRSHGLLCCLPPGEAKRIWLLGRRVGRIVGGCVVNCNGHCCFSKISWHCVVPYLRLEFITPLEIDVAVWLNCFDKWDVPPGSWRASEPSTTPLLTLPLTKYDLSCWGSTRSPPGKPWLIYMTPKSFRLRAIMICRGGDACDCSVTYPTQADTYRKCASLNPPRRLILLLGKHPTEMCELLHQEICTVRGFKDLLVGWFPIVRVLSLSERKVQWRLPRVCLPA